MDALHAVRTWTLTYSTHGLRLYSAPRAGNDPAAVGWWKRWGCFHCRSMHLKNRRFDMRIRSFHCWSNHRHKMLTIHGLRRRLSSARSFSPDHKHSTLCCWSASRQAWFRAQNYAGAFLPDWNSWNLPHPRKRHPFHYLGNRLHPKIHRFANHCEMCTELPCRKAGQCKLCRCLY